MRHHFFVGCSAEGHQLLYGNVIADGVVLMNDRRLLCKFLAVQVVDIPAAEKYLTAFGVEVLCHQREQSRFSAAVRTDHGSDLTLCDFEGNVTQYLVFTIGKSDPSHLHCRSFFLWLCVRHIFSTSSAAE